MELGAFVSRRILRPLGMDDSRVAFAPDSSWAGLVPTSYEWSEATGPYEVQWTPDRPQRWAFFPAAFGLFGSARDYGWFVDPDRTDDGLPLGFRHGGDDGILVVAYPADRGIVVYLSPAGPRGGVPQPRRHVGPVRFMRGRT